MICHDSGMLSAADATVIALERRYPGWMVWHITCAVPPDRWSARRHDEGIASLCARSPEDLDRLLAAASGAGHE